MKMLGKEKMKKSYKPKRRNFRRRSNLYDIEDDAIDEESESDECCSKDEREVNIFMVQGEFHDEHVVDDEEEEVEAEVDLEGELMSALELRKVRREYKKVKYVVGEEQDRLNKCLEESEKNISDLRTQLDEAKRMYEVTKSDLQNKEKAYQKMEEEIVNLRKEIKKHKDELKMRIKYEGNTDALDKILNKEKHSKEIEGVGLLLVNSLKVKTHPVKKYTSPHQVKMETNKLLQFANPLRRRHMLMPQRTNVLIQKEKPSCNGDKETRLFMAHETDIESHSSKGDNAGRSHWYDVFDNDTEEEEDAEADLEGELLSALDELKNVRNELKDYKKSDNEKCSKLRSYLEDSNKKVTEEGRHVLEDTTLVEM
ncbi:uncharacterized protein LOC131857502 [Cryptomeria japonica]|uniref:uncharacterized protein LOC131857502 n=1 Tax=Cryptomeria japonica TaxID=3369 RepID=UPI0027DA1992|nr:uncharacterized protein LOC131857502 [Cryptomeria japonica]